METESLEKQILEEASRCEVDIESILSHPQKPYKETKAEVFFNFIRPFLKYVFNIKPAIPNIIYVIVSVGVMQLLQAKDFFPKIDWLEPVLFWGLFIGISIQILFASAKTISIPLLTLAISAWAIWAQTSQGVITPINTEILQYMMVIGVVGVITSSILNP